MNNPHDKFFKETMTRRPNAVSFFNAYLPGEIVENIDLRTLVVCKDSFIDAELQERFSDILYEVRLMGQPFYIYLLMEHQSTPDPSILFRILSYNVKIWELYRKQNPGVETLPGIVSTVFYHGKEKWKPSTQFQDIVPSSDIVPEYIPAFKTLFMDFSSYSDLEIKGAVMLRLFLSVMRNIYSPNFEEALNHMIPLFAELSRLKTGMEYIATTLRYVYSTSDKLHREPFEEKLIHAIDEDKKEEIMTIAEQLRNEGRIKGRIEGEIRGKIEGSIKTYEELMNEGKLPKAFAQLKINELMKELEQLEFPSDQTQIH